jgi:hypothetical protein
MTIMMSKLYDALRAADVPDDKARAAAEEAAEIQDVKSTLHLHTWILTANTAGILTLIGLALHRG